MLKYDINKLKSSALGRPEGFVAFVLAHGKVEGDFVVLPNEVERKIVQTFPPIKFWTAQLKTDAQRLPKGFANFIYSRGKMHDGYVELDLAALDELHEKFPILTPKIHQQKFADVIPGNIIASIRSIHQSGEAIDDEAIDRLLGVAYEETENSIPVCQYGKSICRMWPKRNTQSSFEKIRKTYAHLPLRDGAIVYDLGSGHGRVLLYGACLFPKVRFKGVELVSERAKATQQAARNAKLSNVELINENVLDVDLSDGTVFYFFNPFPAMMDIILCRLRQVALKVNITLVTSGRTTSDVANVPWLKIIKQFGHPNYGLTFYESE
jgi:hypothetical protein